MNTKLRKALSEMTEVEYHQVRMAMSLAGQARQIRDEFNLSLDDCISEFQVAENDMKAYLNGGFEYTMKDMAIMQVAYHRLATKRAAEKVEADTKNMVRINGLDA